ncbi:maleylacetoacetate isomerase [Sphingomonas spermidinifaciens]|uniref:Maleylacetoacetate isomerase n=1 Tax=Sphingomonas spermidinifaciens TaxID=1141889 RepID=A0A2A4B8H7_9SPHN|nr:maleylacetoacetate isomerase [Sphingomonas spermidinifaciens]PCD04370.1 maleylacetoacetate isomerase [Sphingomonas spermidinifaciens]
MSGYVLHDYYRSSASYRVRIALNLKGVDYRRHDVSLLDGSQRSPEHLARSAQGFVPVLELPGGRMLTQSLAIIDWLDAAHPELRLTPADPLLRADGMARALMIACDIHPLNNLRVLKRLKYQFDADDEGRNDWYRHWVAEGLAPLEAMAGNGRFLGGDAPDVSDVCLVPQLFNARRFDLDLSPYPRLTSIEAAMLAIPAVSAAHPDAVA